MAAPSHPCLTEASPAAPVISSPPGFVMAAAKRAVAIEPVPAPTIGGSIPSIVQRRMIGATVV